MGLEGASTEALARSKTDYETFLADPENLKLVREKLATEGLTAEQRHVLEVPTRRLRGLNLLYHARIAAYLNGMPRSSCWSCWMRNAYNKYSHSGPCQKGLA